MVKPLRKVQESFTQSPAQWISVEGRLGILLEGAYMDIEETGSVLFLMPGNRHVKIDIFVI